MLVRLMEAGEVDSKDLAGLSLSQLAALGTAGVAGRDLVHKVTLQMKELGLTFAEIAELMNVVESTASRWAKPPKPMGRPRRRRDGEETTNA